MMLWAVLNFLLFVALLVHFLRAPIRDYFRTRGERLIEAVQEFRDAYRAQAVAAGGIVGTVRRVDDDTISLQVADNVVIKVDRGSVSKRLTES